MIKNNQPTVFINGKFLSQSLSGVQRFASDFCNTLKDKNKYLILAPRAVNYNSFHNITIKKIGFFEGHFWEQIELPLYLYLNSKKNILINLCNLAPIFYKYNIVVIMDLAFFRNPNWFSWKFRLFYKFFIPTIARNAKKVLTISKFSKLEIKNFLNVDSEVVYPRSIFSRTKTSRVLKKKTYFIAVGSNNARKNTEFLFVSFNKLNLNLKIIGRSSRNFKTYKNILFFDYNDNQLIKAITQSRALISASLYEGFNLPPLEAQSLGVPVILSDIPVHREIYGDTALYFNSDSMDELEAALNKLKSKKLYSDLVRKGYANALRFDDYRNNFNELKSFGMQFHVKHKERK